VRTRGEGGDERHSKLGMLGRRGPTDHPVHGGWRGDHATTTVEGGGGGKRGGRVKRHRRVTKSGVRSAVDNNNYYTPRSFANAVLRGGWQCGAER